MRSSYDVAVELLLAVSAGALPSHRVVDDGRSSGEMEPASTEGAHTGSTGSPISINRNDVATSGGAPASARSISLRPSPKCDHPS